MTLSPCTQGSIPILSDRDSTLGCPIRPLRGLQQPSLFRYENNPDAITAAILTILFNAELTSRSNPYLNDAALDSFAIRAPKAFLSST